MSGDALDDYYADLKDGLAVETFLRRHKEILSFVHSRDLTADYRLGRGRVKVLSDEVSPVARFASNHAEPDDVVRFALDNTYPDCVMRGRAGLSRDIEVTVAQARKRRYLMTELNKTGSGRAFIDVAEDATEECFEVSMESEPEAYSTDQLIAGIQHDIELRAQRKKFHKGDTLLIEADLETLPPHRWKEFVAQLAEKAKDLRFREVYLTGRSDDGDIAIKLR